MPSAHPYLASWERRIVAAIIDAALLLCVGLFLYGVLESQDSSEEALLFVLACTYIGYHAVSILHPEYSLGRTVTGIVVVPFNRRELSVARCVARPLVRAVLICLCVFFADKFDVFWLWAPIIIVELVLMSHTPWRRTVADRLAGTVVVNRPPLQPHRAPAYPMYSERDEEFGPKP
jgi:uncharacterized RDD family membrane protein YckC